MASFFCSDLERIGNSLSKLDTQHTLLGKSGLLWNDPIQDKTPLYDQLMQTYSWTQKVWNKNWWKSFAKWPTVHRFRLNASWFFLQLSVQARIATESLKRHHVLDDDTDETAVKRPLKENLFVPQRCVSDYKVRISENFFELCYCYLTLCSVSCFTIFLWNILLYNLLLLNAPSSTSYKLTINPFGFFLYLAP